MQGKEYFAGFHMGDEKDHKMAKIFNFYLANVVSRFVS